MKPSFLRLWLSLLTLLPFFCQAQFVQTSAYSGAGVDGNGTVSTNTYSGDSGLVSSGSTHQANSVESETAPGPDGINWSCDSNGYGWATAESGRLHLMAYAQSTVTPSSYIHDDVEDDNPLTSQSSGGSAAYLQDTITITSSTLPSGTPVDLRVTGTFDYTLSVAPPGVPAIFGNRWQFPQASVNYTLAFYRPGSYYTDDSGNVNFCDIEESYDGSVHSITRRDTNVLHTAVGEQFDVHLNARVDCSTSADSYNPVDNAEAHAENTAFFNLDPITVGASYTAASGLSYLTHPTLKTSAVANQVVISWPSPSLGWTLEQTADLNSPAWSPSSGTVSDDGTNKSMTISPSSSGLFFRLSHP